MREGPKIPHPWKQWWTSQDDKSDKSPADCVSYKYSLPWALIGLRNGN